MSVFDHKKALRDAKYHDSRYLLLLAQSDEVRELWQDMSLTRDQRFRAFDQWLRVEREVEQYRLLACAVLANKATKP